MQGHLWECTGCGQAAPAPGLEPKMGVRKAKERHKMARNIETAVTRCQLQDSVAVGKAVQGSQVQLKVPNTCSYGR